MASFRKRGDKWEYRISYYDREVEKYKVKAKGGFSTKKEAQIEASQEELNIHQTGLVEDGNMFLKDYLNEWLEVYKKPNIRPITYTVIERNVRLNIIPRFGNYKLKEIKRKEYQQWINELVDKYSIGVNCNRKMYKSCSLKMYNYCSFFSSVSSSLIVGRISFIR